MALFASPAAWAQGVSPFSPLPVSGGTLERALPGGPATPGAHASSPVSSARSEPRSAPQSAKPKPAPAAREFALPHDPTPSLQPDTFYATAKASERYAAIADAGGWPRIPTALNAASKGPAVALLRQRLAIEGDLDASAATGEIWTPELGDAVRRFQMRMGLAPTGAVAGKTLAAMNVSAAQRFRQLASSAQRIAGLEFGFGQRYVVVNIPSAYVEAVENGRVVRRFVAVVGDVKRQSPMVTTRIVSINLNPTWTAPTSIIRSDIIPKMKRDPGYLARARIRVLDGNGTEINPAAINWSSMQATNYTLRQDPGSGNALGNIRINMPNKDAVYMHDTPSKRLFANDYRFLSFGCVRVEGVFDLAEWLLKDTPGGWTKANMLKIVASQKRHDIRLAQPVAVTWVYMTGWADSRGVAHFRDDVYKLDRIGGARAALAR